MTAKEKARELVDDYQFILTDKTFAKDCALIAVTNEYNSLREQLFNLRVCGMIDIEKVYIHRMDELFQVENELKYEIQQL
jgi:hypothetical protein